jgi:hypothetical protein
MTPSQEAAGLDALKDNPAAVDAHAFVGAKAVWDRQVNDVVAAVRHQAADYRARMGLPDDAPVVVTVPEFWRSSVARVLADDPTVTVADPA